MRCFGDKTKTHHCKVVLLDEQELIQEVQDTTTGQDLLDVVLQHLNLLETAYFGLRFLDLDSQTHWLDPAKKLVKQLKGTSPFTLYFSVKFYAADPTKLVEEITRYQFFLQVKQDILQGRLPITNELAAELGSYAVQSELGDYDPRRHSPGYVSEFRFMAGQTATLEGKIGEMHKKLVGQVPAKAELCYLEKIKWLEMYGVDLHPVLGEDNIEYFLGLTPSGVIVLRNKNKVGNYFWPRIAKVYFKGRFFMLRVRDKNNSENTYGFETPSRSACKHLWQCCVEHHAFFRLTQTTGNTPQAVFSLGSKFRYSGRTEKEIVKEAREVSRQQPEVTRTPSRRYQRRVIEGAVDTPKIEDADPKIEPRLPLSSLVNSNVYRSTSMTLNGRVSSSPRSIRSAPYQAASTSVPPLTRGRPDEPLKGTYRVETRSESRGSPRGSVRSAAPVVMVQSHSKRLSRRTSSVESQSSVDSRGHRRHRRRSRCRSSDGGESEGSSRCSSKGHRRHHKKKHHKHNGDDSSEHNSTHRHKHRRHRHRSGDSGKQLVESEEQWVRVQAGENQIRGNTATVRTLGSNKGYGYEPSIDTDTHSHSRNSSKKKHRKHRSRSRSPSEHKNSRYPSEIKRHIDYHLKDCDGLTEEELRGIPYTRVQTKAKSSAGQNKKHKSPKRSKSSSSDRKLTPPDGESPPPAFMTENLDGPLRDSERKVDKVVNAHFYRGNPSGESSTPPPPPNSVPPNAPVEVSPIYREPVERFSTPLHFPGYLPHRRDGRPVSDTWQQPPNFGGPKVQMISGPSIKSIVSEQSEMTLYSRPSALEHRDLSNGTSSGASSTNSSSPCGVQLSSSQDSFHQTYMKQSTLERGTRGSAISKPQPSPQSSVTSGISVGGSSVSNRSPPYSATSHPPLHPIIKTSDLSASPPYSSSPSPPNDDKDHIFMHPPVNSFKTVDGRDNSFNDSISPPPPYFPKPLEDSKHIYSNVHPYTHHSTNIFIQYQDGDLPKPQPRNSIISVNRNPSSHIVQSHTPAYANTLFSNGKPLVLSKCPSSSSLHSKNINLIDASNANPYKSYSQDRNKSSLTFNDGQTSDWRPVVPPLSNSDVSDLTRATDRQLRTQSRLSDGTSRSTEVGNTAGSSGTLVYRDNATNKDWTASLGRIATARSHADRKRSNQSSYGVTSEDTAYRSGPGSLEMVLRPLIESAMHREVPNFLWVRINPALPSSDTRGRSHNPANTSTTIMEEDGDYRLTKPNSNQSIVRGNEPQQVGYDSNYATPIAPPTGYHNDSPRRLSGALITEITDCEGYRATMVPIRPVDSWKNNINNKVYGNQYHHSNQNYNYHGNRVDNVPFNANVNNNVNSPDDNVNRNEKFRYHMRKDENRNGNPVSGMIAKMNAHSLDDRNGKMERDEISTEL